MQSGDCHCTIVFMQTSRRIISRRDKNSSKIVIHRRLFYWNTNRHFIELRIWLEPETFFTTARSLTTQVIESLTPLSSKKSFTYEFWLRKFHFWFGNVTRKFVRLINIHARASLRSATNINNRNDSHPRHPNPTLTFNHFCTSVSCFSYHWS